MSRRKERSALVVHYCIAGFCCGAAAGGAVLLAVGLGRAARCRRHHDCPFCERAQ